MGSIQERIEGTGKRGSKSWIKALAEPGETDPEWGCRAWSWTRGTPLSPEGNKETGREGKIERSGEGLGGIHRKVRVWNSHWGRRENGPPGAIWKVIISVSESFKKILLRNLNMNSCKCGNQTWAFSERLGTPFVGIPVGQAWRGSPWAWGWLGLDLQTPKHAETTAGMSSSGRQESASQLLFILQTATRRVNCTPTLSFSGERSL